MKHIVKKLVKTCESCPAQWDGTLDNGRAIYIRYRYGQLRVDVEHEDSKPNPVLNELITKAHFGNGGQTIYYEKLGEDFDGDMTEQELESHLEGIVSFELEDG